MKLLYYDCFAGISGDMHLGAMIDAGVDPDHLINELHKLSVKGFHLHICRDQRKSIEGTRVDVILDDEETNHDHHHGHSHDHGSHGHSHHDHSQPHRNLADIESIVFNSTLPEATKNRAMAMFRLIAKAEAKIHGMPIEKIHFHEVGALDSIVDIIGAAICLEYLKPDRILSSPVELGSGTIRCAHGIMPVPAPATLEILKGIPVRSGSTTHEATTPTGAAILAANVDEFTENPGFIPQKTAYGIGQRDPELPNILRVIVAETDANTSNRETCTLLESNIDDMNPEFYDHVMDQLYAKGALDVYMTPVLMKKNRPAIILSVLAPSGKSTTLTKTMLTHTTTLGVREQQITRTILDREQQVFNSSLGPVTIKTSWLAPESKKWKPEYEDCKKIADETHLPVIEVYRTIVSELSRSS